MNNKTTTQIVESGFFEKIIFEWGIYFLIFLVSVIALTIIIERLYFYFKKSKSMSYYFIARLKDTLAEEKYEQALALLEQNGGPAAKVLQVGIEQRMAGSDHVIDEMQQAGNEQVAHLEKYLTGLATIATIAPLLGILGTVLGMIKAFQYYSASSNKFEMMGGINVALITTALGLVVAIPSYIFYNFLTRKMNEKIVEMEGAVNQIQQVIAKKG